MSNIDKCILQIQKAIRNNNISNSQLYYIIQLLNRQYIEIVVRDNILKMIDNSSYRDNSCKNNSNKDNNLNYNIYKEPIAIQDDINKLLLEATKEATKE